MRSRGGSNKGRLSTLHKTALVNGVTADGWEAEEKCGSTQAGRSVSIGDELGRET
jgi:hypothetical protein